MRRVLLAQLVLAVLLALWALQERRERLAVSERLARLEAQELREQQALQAQLEAWVRQGVLARQVPPELLAARVQRVRQALQEQLAQTGQ